MHDTPKNIEDMMALLMMQKTPTQRIEMASGMFSTARKLVEAGLLHENPNLSRAQLRARTFMRFYGGDFNESEVGRIMQGIPDMQLDD